MLAASAAGASDPAALVALARGRLCKQRAALAAALSGRVRAHHRFRLTALLAQLDAAEETSARFDDAIARACAAKDDAPVVALRDPIPGSARGTAELLVAASGVDLRRFASADHLASWAGWAPGNHQSGGRQRAGRTRTGNRWLRAALVAAAHAAARTTQSALGAPYRRLKARRGAKQAILAVAHSRLVLADHVIARREPSRELGAAYFDQHQPVATANRLLRRRRRLGYDVSISATPEPTAPVDAVAVAT